MKYFLALVFALSVWYACAPSKQVIYRDRPVNPTECKPGESREEACKDGEEGLKVEICNQEGSWQLASNSCEEPVTPPRCSETIFADIKPILTDRCVRCHSGYDQYNVTQRKWDSYMYRINLPSSDPRAMPPGTNLSPGDKAKLEKFESDGLLQDCDKQASLPPGRRNLADIEREILADLTRLQPQDRLITRYLVSEDAFRLQLDEAGWNQGIQKQANSLSLESVIRRAEPINKLSTVYRIKLDDFGQDRDDWDLIERFDTINFESFTSEGLLIKFLTQTEKPWFHASNWAFITNKAPVYYNILEVPKTLDEFFKLGFVNVNIEDEIKNLRARFVGFNGSPITIQKNRLIVRYESQEGYLWQTYDVFDLNKAENNLFNFPLLEVGKAQYEFDASEIIVTMPNGLQLYALFNAAGGREDFAPTNLVFDSSAGQPNGGLDPQIDNALDCHRCHKSGLLQINDQVKDHVRRNAGQFDIDDVQFVEFLYTENSSALFQRDNSFYLEQLQKAGNDGSIDTVNLMVDHLRTDYDLAKLAAFLFVKEEQLKACLTQSGVLQGEIGQLITGGTISLEQLENSIQNIFDECGFNNELFYP